MKTNNEKYKKLKRHQKHSKPSKWEYPILVSMVGVLNVLLLKWLYRRVRWGSFLLTIVCCLIPSIIWGYLHIHFDPSYSGWMYDPVGITGIDYVFTLGDWLFWPIFGILFLFIMILVPRRKQINAISWPFTIGFILKFGLALSFWLYGDLSCVLTSICFVAGGLYLQCKHRYYDWIHDLIIGIIIVGLATGWDIVWPQWFYISWCNGTPFHSVIYHDYPKWWILNRIPLAITYFVMGSWWWIYGVYYFWEEKLYTKEKFTSALDDQVCPDCKSDHIQFKCETCGYGWCD